MPNRRWPMRKFDFDKIVDRKNTDCLKYDFAVKRGMPEGILPLWVADMDFQIAPAITEALEKRVAHRIFGYSEATESYFEAVKGWMKKRHGWDVSEEWLIKTPGIVFALAMAVKAFTKEGDGVLIQQPVYYPFSEVIRDNNRKVISNDLIQNASGHYEIDFDDFEKKIITNKIKLFILCSPHNPVGRVWTRDELIKIGDICIKHGVIVVADEIHEDFVYEPHKHTVFAGIKEEFRNNSITCTSPGKTFNLAGLQVSNIFIPNESLREKMRHEINAAGYSQLNTLGLVACQAAYTYGDEWYEEMIAYIKSNIEFFKSYVKENIPQLKVVDTEGTYLVWVDFRELGLTNNELENLIVNRANLWLDSGAIFGQTGEGFQRFNVACARTTLEQALMQLKSAIG